jgi:hypothetical protein
MKVTQNIRHRRLAGLLTIGPVLAFQVHFAAPCASAGSRLQPAPAALRLHSANPHYLEFRGKPLVLVTSGEMYGSIVNLDFNYVKYLDTLQSDGLNLARIFVGGYNEVLEVWPTYPKNNLIVAPGRFIVPWAASSEAGAGRGGHKFDLSRWNPAFFDRLKDFIRQAAKREIFVEVTFTSALYADLQWKIHPLHPANNVSGTSEVEWRSVHTLENGNLLGHQEKLMRKLVRELNEFANIYYEIQNEPWADNAWLSDVVNPYMKEPVLYRFPNAITIPSDASLKWQKHMTAVLAEEESRLPVRHLIAQNYCNFRCSPAEVDPAISIMNFHYAYPEVVAINYGWNRVASYDESGFLNVPPDAGYRREAWSFLLAGGGIYDGLDLSITVGKEDGTDEAPVGTAGGSPALRRQLGILKRFLQSFDFPRMQPDTSFVRTSPGAIMRGLSRTGEQYALYLTGKGVCPLEVNLPKGEYRVEWVDTTSGSVVKSEDLNHSGGLRILASPEFSLDIALAIKKRGGEAAQP